MAGINVGSGELPAPTSLFGATSTASPGSSSTTTRLNVATLDQPNQTWPTLTNAHVMTFRAIGTPDAKIGEIAAMNLSASYLDQYIKSEIMQNPEGWDDLCGNRRGTARAGLQQLMPGLQLPAPGTGTPGRGLDVDSGPAPAQASEAENLIKGAVLAAAAIGVGLLAWKFFKGRKPPTEAVKLATDATQGFRGVAAGGSAAATASDLAQHLGERVLGGVNSHAASTAAAATADSLSRGLGPANGFINSTGISALQFNMPMREAVGAALADRYIGVLEAATASGQLGAFAAAHGAMRTAAVQGAQLATAGAPNAALRAALTDLLHALPM